MSLYVNKRVNNLLKCTIYKIITNNNTTTAYINDNVNNNDNDNNDI